MLDWLSISVSLSLLPSRFVLHRRRAGISAPRIHGRSISTRFSFRSPRRLTRERYSSSSLASQAVVSALSDLSGRLAEGEKPGKKGSNDPRARTLSPLRLAQNPAKINIIPAACPGSSRARPRSRVSIIQLSHPVTSRTDGRRPQGDTGPSPCQKLIFQACVPGGSAWENLSANVAFPRAAHRRVNTTLTKVCSERAVNRRSLSNQRLARSVSADDRVNWK